MYYECHITMKGDKDELRKRVEGNQWLFSCIDGDPVLGKGTKCYATTLLSCAKYSLEQAVAVVNKLAAMLPNVIRQKVELVVYDTKKVKL